jgi:hypothetical protein
MAPGRLAGRIGLRDQQRRRSEVATPRGVGAQCAQIDGQLVQRAAGPGEPDLLHEQRPPEVVVPQRAGGRLGHPAPPESVLHGDVGAGEYARGLPQRPGRCGWPVDDQPGQAVQDQIDRAKRVAARRECPGCPGYLVQIARSRQSSGEQGRHPRAEVGLARQIEVERLQPLGRLEQQRGRVAAQTRGERDLTAQQVHPSALHLVQRPHLRGDEQLQRLVERAGLEVGPGRGQRALRMLCRFGRQQDRTLEECRGRGQPAPGLRPAGRALQLGGDVLVRPGRALRPVPRPPIGIGPGIGDLRQRGVRRVPVLHRSRPVGRRSHQRVPEPHLHAELDQAGLHGRCRGQHRKAQPAGGPPDQHRVAGGIGCCQLEQPSGLRRQVLQLSSQPVLDPARQRRRGRQPEPAGHLHRRQRPRQLQQRERVAPRLGDDQITDPRIHRPG